MIQFSCSDKEETSKAREGERVAFRSAANGRAFVKCCCCRRRRRRKSVVELKTCWLTREPVSQPASEQKRMLLPLVRRKFTTFPELPGGEIALSLAGASLPARLAALAALAEEKIACLPALLVFSCQRCCRNSLPAATWLRNLSRFFHSPVSRQC